MLTVLEKADLLQGIEIFCDIRTQSLARVSAIAQEVQFDPHQRLFSENEAADAMYVILGGEVTLTRGGIEQSKLARFGIAGALALVADHPHAETASANGSVHALRIAQHDLFDAMSEDFGITRGIMRALAGKAVAR